MNDNIVYIGRKPVMSYCNAVLQVMANNDSVKLVARGRAISHAVDVAEITRNRFLTDLTVDSIDIGTEELESEHGEKRNVSNITITLKK
jgi:DNA-binding protein